MLIVNYSKISTSTMFSSNKRSLTHVNATNFMDLLINDGSFRILNVSRYNVCRAFPYLFLTSSPDLGLPKRGLLSFSSLEPLLCLRAFSNARIKSAYKDVYVPLGTLSFIKMAEVRRNYEHWLDEDNEIRRSTRDQSEVTFTTHFVNHWIFATLSNAISYFSIKFL